MPAPERKPVESRRVQLMATCLCDAFFDDVAIATVQVLEHLGCEVSFPEAQTCCGQPAFNGGDWPVARRVFRHMLDVFGGDDPVVTPSGSCAAMVFHGARLAFENEPDLDRVESLGARTWELADFIVNGLGVKTWPGRFSGRLAFHRSCHSRGSGSGKAAGALLGSIQGIELVEIGEDDQCCGFGGTFSVTFPHISASMGRLKLENVRVANPQVLCSGDMSCLMHLRGMVERDGPLVKTLHLAQVLRDSLKNGKRL